MNTIILTQELAMKADGMTIEVGTQRFTIDTSYFTVGGTPVVNSMDVYGYNLVDGEWEHDFDISEMFTPGDEINIDENRWALAF